MNILSVDDQNGYLAGPNRPNSSFSIIKWSFGPFFISSKSRTHTHTRGTIFTHIGLIQLKSKKNYKIFEGFDHQVRYNRQRPSSLVVKAWAWHSHEPEFEPWEGSVGDI